MVVCGMQRVALLLVVAWLRGCSAHAGNCPFYKTTVGDFNLTVLSDGVSTGVPLETFLPDDAPQGIMEQVRALHFLPELVKPEYNVVYLETEEHRVLIDAGSSNISGPSLGKLLDNMALAGLKPKDVDVLLFSHAHPDHISGALKPDGSYAFPNAKYLMPRIEYEFWTTASLEHDAIKGWGVSDDVKAGMLEAIKATITALQKKMEVFEFGDDVLPGITSKGLPGHTPGHSGFLLRSGDETLILTADALIMDFVNIEHPEWPMSFDLNRTEAINTRYSLLNELADSRMKGGYYHIGFPGFGHIYKTTFGFGFRPARYEVEPL